MGNSKNKLLLIIHPVLTLIFGFAFGVIAALVNIPPVGTLICAILGGGFGSAVFFIYLERRNDNK